MKLRRFFTAALAMMLLLLSVVSVAPKAEAAISTSEFTTKAQQFVADSRWKNGIAWGDSQTPKLSSWSSTGCCAYAADFVAYVYGSKTAAWTTSDFTKYTNLNDIKAGDIVHTSNHWFVVLERNGDSLKTIEGNYDDKVRVSTDGWGIKNGKLYHLKANAAQEFVYGYHYKFSDSTSAGSATQIYYNIDFTADVLKSRTNQQVSGDCAVVSMVTAESYLHGATSAADKKTVYNALVSKNGDNDYAYWSNCGYASYDSIDWNTVYDNLASGYPVLVHRPAANGKAQHWAVVAGYTGSTTTLETGKFKIVDVYHGSGGTDIYTSAAWATGTKIDRMVLRRAGIAVTGLSGIHMAINTPAVVHHYGEGHGVLGQISSNVNLTSVQIMITNLTTGSNVYNKTVTPNAKSYNVFNQDPDITFAKYAEGEYFFTVIAKTANATKHIQKYFTIDATWPTKQPARAINFKYNLNGGSGSFSAQTVNHGSTLTLPTATPTKSGYTFKGWNVKRTSDSNWYTTSGWKTEAQITANGYTRQLYTPGVQYVINYSWTISAFMNQEFTFYAVWEKNAQSSENVKKGWVKENGKWYYYENGTMVKNAWRSDSAGKCYLGADGAQLINAWAKENGEWRYLNGAGYMTKNDWAQDSWGWCYLGADGAMVKNAWALQGTKWRYLNSMGYLTKNDWAKDSWGWCFLDENGEWVKNAWRKDTKGWCYIDSYGYWLKNGWAKDSQGWCYMGSDGYKVYNTWKADTTGWCYVGSDGYMVTNGWAKDSQGWYWMDATGYISKKAQRTIGGKTYYFDTATGLCKNY